MDCSREFQQQAPLLLNETAARRQETRRSTTHGAEFELELGHAMRPWCHAAGDVFDAVVMQNAERKEREITRQLDMLVSQIGRMRDGD